MVKKYKANENRKMVPWMDNVCKIIDKASRELGAKNFD